MLKLKYKDGIYTINELSEMSGIEPFTLRDRLRRGYPIEEAMKETPIRNSVKEFCDASWYEDWIGMSTECLYKIYWKWCISHGYEAVKKQGFMRHIFKIYPNLKTVPTKKEFVSQRIIRER